MKLEEKTVASYHGRPIKFYDLENQNGLRARLMNYGATLISLLVPDRTGCLEDITLGFDNFEGYLGNNPYFGATIGRYANRIGGARFFLEGKEYPLARNEGPNHLHGGLKGFDKVIWEAEPVSDSRSIGVRFNYLSPDGQEGYPGNLDCQVTYLLNQNDELHIAYLATTDRPTHVNLTNHSYFNLAGSRKDNILEHILQIMASRFTPADERLIPTGEIKEVAGTALDFLKPMSIGQRLNELPAGHDHNFVLASRGELALAARVVEPGSGRVMELYTTEPGLQFYSGNYLDGTITGKFGRPYERHSGFCLEPQHFPDSPNKPQFPSTLLKPGEVYKSLTVFKFLTD